MAPVIILGLEKEKERGEMRARMKEREVYVFWFECLKGCRFQRLRTPKVNK